jgi:hypothetical protein
MTVFDGSTTFKKVSHWPGTINKSVSMQLPLKKNRKNAAFWARNLNSRECGGTAKKVALTPRIIA